MSDDTKPIPVVFEYGNYRLYLRDMYQAMKSKNRKYSLRYLARIAGFSSHNFLLQVMKGESNLSLESISKVATGLKMNAEEEFFFRNLVLLNQAATSEEKQIYAKEILNSKSYKKIYPLNESKYQFFSNWYFSAVRELVSLPNFQEDPTWIAEHVVPPIKPHEAQKALDELIKLELLARNEEGRLQQTDKLVKTPPEVSSAYVSNWHKEYMKRASESIDLVPREKRDISAVSFGFSKKNIKILKELMENVRKEVRLLASQEQDKDIILQLNLQIFPLAEIDESDK